MTQNGQIRTGNLVGTELVPIETNITDAEFKRVIVKELEEMNNYIRPHEARQLIDATLTPMTELKKEPTINAEYRNHLLFNILWQTGARISEVLKLRPIDITDAGIQMVTLKQRLETKKINSRGSWSLRPTPLLKKRVARRTISIQSELRSEIMTFAFKTKVHPDALFFPLTARRVQQILDELGKKCNITYKKLHPHLFRHGFAVNYINQNGSLARLQKILGHNQIQTTMIYLKLSDNDIARDIERMVF